jgi:membrane protein required for colicin V production
VTPLDWVIIGIFVVSFITAVMNGFFVELFSIFGLIAGVIVAGMYYTQFARWLSPYIHSVPAADAAAFLLIAIGVLIAAGIVGRIVRWLLRKVGLGWADRLLGLVFGAVKGCVLATALAMAVAAFFPDRPWVLHSQLLPYFVGAAHQGSSVVPGTLGEKVRHGVRIFRKESPPSTAGSGTVTF